ncbi:hypothetical protein GCM10012275_56190 [Longimycelium tulufanense]|uniref:HNH nuclease domain-containing protein n=1 Tax=Longimycelium tulufanense TaxID=907463 RepID=A0A8J3CKQ7_9PSEU|nr:hypothetical protein GCM10012275_56190 [Longimycelium tulufanense]
MCALCGNGFSATALDVDHIRPLADGGTDTADNVRALCRSCHRAVTTAQARARAERRRAKRARQGRGTLPGRTDAHRSRWSAT